MMAFPPHSSLFSSRKQREFTPDSKKDDTYWDRRRRNNAAAKRSREKRRLNDMLLEKRVVQLSRENHILRAQVTAVFKSYGYLSKIGTKTRENTKNLSINCFLDAFSLRSFRT